MLTAVFLIFLLKIVTFPTADRWGRTHGYPLMMETGHAKKLQAHLPDHNNTSQMQFLVSRYI